MSEVPLLDAKTSLKKIVSSIVNISSVNSDFIPKLRAQPEHILSSIERYENVKSGLVNTIESNNENISQLKNKILQNQRDITQLGEDNTELAKRRQELSAMIQTKQNELKHTQESIHTKSDELAVRSERLKELESAIFESTRELEKFDGKLKALEKELENTFMKKERFVLNYENRVKAMKILINEKYINSLLYQFIKALQVGSALDLKNILLAIDMRDDQAKKIINKMIEDDAPITYDPNSGTITLNEEVDFK